MRTRAFLIGLAALAAVTLSLVVVGVVAGTARQSTPRHPTTSLGREAPATGVAADAVAVLRHWDRRRARAWSHADPGAVAALYAPDSRSGARDVTLLRRYARRGVRVTGLRMQVFDVRVRRRTGDRLSLLATDRVVDAVAVGHGRRQALPQDRPSVRRIDLRRRDGRWVVVEAWDVGRGQPAR